METPIRLLCVGDSHLYAVKQAAEIGLIKADECRFSIVPGATAVGLRNPNSITDAMSIFNEDIYKRPTDTYLLIQIGEVDCGFVIWYRSTKYGESVERQMYESLKAYQDFIMNLMRRGYKHICITGAILPTIRDDVDFGTVANARSEIRVPLLERTRLTLEYNVGLKKLSEELNINYLELTQKILSKESFVVDDNFRNPDPRDHHLDPLKMAPLWASLCNQFLSVHKYDATVN